MSQQSPPADVPTELVSRTPLLIVPSLAIDLLVRALGTCVAGAGPVTRASARLLPIEESQVTVVRLEADVDTEAVARALSVGGTPVAIVEVPAQRWRTYEEGKLIADYGPNDALHVPLDASGDPDLDAEPTPLRELGGRPSVRIRTALDRGMQALASCRFGPVAHALAEPEDERHFQLISHGHRAETELPR